MKTTSPSIAGRNRAERRLAKIVLLLVGLLLMLVLASFSAPHAAALTYRNVTAWLDPGDATHWVDPDPAHLGYIVDGNGNTILEMSAGRSDALSATAVTATAHAKLLFAGSNTLTKMRFSFWVRADGSNGGWYYITVNFYNGGKVVHSVVFPSAGQPPHLDPGQTVNDSKEVAVGMAVDAVELAIKTYSSDDWSPIGGSTADVSWGIYDIAVDENTTPKCESSSNVHFPNTVTFKLQDMVSGIKTIETLPQSLAPDQYPPFDAGTTDPISLTFTNTDPSQKPRAGMIVTDTEGNATACSTEFTSALAADLFSRTITNGWGRAPVGGGYTLRRGRASNFGVNGSDGWILHTLGNTDRRAFLVGVRTQDVDATFRVKTDKEAAGASEIVFLETRAVNPDYSFPSAAYLARLRFAPDGSVRLQAVRQANVAQILLGREVMVSGLKQAAGQYVRLRVQVVGTNPTTLQMRAWRDGDSEPAGWPYSATDSEPKLQMAGAVGIRTYVGPQATNLPIIFSFGDLVVTPSQ